MYEIIGKIVVATAVWAIAYGALSWIVHSLDRDAPEHKHRYRRYPEDYPSAEPHLDA